LGSTGLLSLLGMCLFAFF